MNHQTRNTIPLEFSWLANITTADLDRLVSYIENLKRPVPLEDLRLEYVQNRLAEDEPTLWSPEKQYHVGDPVTVLVYDEFGKIVRRKVGLSLMARTKAAPMRVKAFGLSMT